MSERTLYHYYAFGMNISSELEMFQLKSVPAADKVDLKISLGDVSASGIMPDDNAEPFCQVYKQDLWLNIKDVCRLLITAGKTITVDVAPGADIQTVKLYLLGSGMGAVLQQRGDLILHGNAIRFDNKAIITVAESGVGKSTLAAEFYCRGHQLLADDVCAIDPQGRVQPSYPYLKLWNDTVDHLQLKREDLIRIRVQREKFYYPLKDAFYSQALPVSSVYILTQMNVDKVQVLRPKGIDKLRFLHNNKYRPLYADKLNLSREHFDRFLEMLNQLHITRIIRPKKQVQCW